MKNEYYMNIALTLAKEAYSLKEVPIGCLIVLDDKIIGRGYNLRNTEKNALYHAEIIAINEACKSINDWRLEKATLYVTVEPCAMCSGAIIQSRIKEVVFGAYNKKFGCGGSIINLLSDLRFNHQCIVTSGVLEKECEFLMKNFFKKFRV